MDKRCNTFICKSVFRQKVSALIKVVMEGVPLLLPLFFLLTTGFELKLDSDLSEPDSSRFWLAVVDVVTSPHSPPYLQGSLLSPLQRPVWLRLPLPGQVLLRLLSDKLRPPQLPVRLLDLRRYHPLLHQHHRDPVHGGREPAGGQHRDLEPDGWGCRRPRGEEVRPWVERAEIPHRIPTFISF